MLDDKNSNVKVGCYLILVVGNNFFIFFLHCIFEGNIAGKSGNNIYPRKILNLVVPNFKSTYNSNDRLIIKLTDNGIPITNVNITIRIYKSNSLIGTYYCLSGDGWLVNLNVGTYIARISVENQDYYANPVNSTLKINKAETRLISKDITAVYKGSGELVATLTNDAGKIISGANILVSLNDEKYTLKTDSEGQVKVSTADLSYGTYVATISYAGNAKYKPSNTTVDVVVTKEDMIISAVYNNADREIVATLINNATGKAVTNVNVKFNINGRDYALKTNSKGQAKLSTADYSFGTATISYAGNSKYNSASASISFDVKTKVIVTDVYAYSDRIVAKLTNGATGKTIANANMIVEINGVKYNVKSDNKGLLTFDTTGLNLPSSYDLTISYRGNDRYTASSATVAVDLNKANMMITTNYHADKQKLVATLKNSKTGKVVSNANMIIDLNGVKTTYKSNDQGKITLLTNDFAPGTYVGTVTYPGNARYNSISAVFKVDV